MIVTDTASHSGIVFGCSSWRGSRMRRSLLTWRIDRVANCGAFHAARGRVVPLTPPQIHSPESARHPRKHRLQSSRLQTSVTHSHHALTNETNQLRQQFLTAILVF